MCKNVDEVFKMCLKCAYNMFFDTIFQSADFFLPTNLV